MADHAGPQHQAGKADVKPLKAGETPSEDAQQDGREQQNQDNGDGAEDGGDNHAGIVGKLVARRRLQGAGAVVGLQDGLGDDFHHKNNRDYHRQHLGEDAVHLRRPGQGEGGEEKARREAENNIHRRVGQAGLHIDVEHQLQVEQQRGEQQHPLQRLNQYGRLAAPGMAPAAAHPSSCITHWNQPPN